MKRYRTRCVLLRECCLDTAVESFLGRPQNSLVFIRENKTWKGSDGKEWTHSVSGAFKVSFDLSGSRTGTDYLYVFLKFTLTKSAQTQPSTGPYLHALGNDVFIPILCLSPRSFSISIPASAFSRPWDIDRT